MRRLSCWLLWGVATLLCLTSLAASGRKEQHGEEEGNRRWFFPALARTRRPYFHHLPKGHGAGRPVHPYKPAGSYPAAKPPKPIGYPASNHPEANEIYITYPPSHNYLPLPATTTPSALYPIPGSGYYPDHKPDFITPSIPDYKPDHKPNYKPDYIPPAIPDYKPDYQKPDYQKPDYQKPDYQKPDYQKPDYQKPDYQKPLPVPSAIPASGPVFIFIPKPGYQQRPPHPPQHPHPFGKPQRPHPVKPHPARPPYIFPPVRPIRPGSSYPPARPRPPTSGYGVPKASPIHSDGYQTSGSHPHAARVHDTDSHSIQPFRKDEELIPIGLIGVENASGKPSTIPDAIPHSGVSTLIHPLDHGNSNVTPAARIPDLALLPQSNAITPPGIPALDARLPKDWKNDCGGSWVILEKPIPDHQPIPADYSRLRSIDPPEELPSGRRVPSLLPSPEVDVTNSVENNFPDVLIFASELPADASGSGELIPDQRSPSELFDQFDPFRKITESKNSFKPSPQLEIPAEASGSFIPLLDNSKLNGTTIVTDLMAANLRAMAAILQETGVASLMQDQEYTLFAPSNLAVGDSAAALRRLSSDARREMALHHVVAGHHVRRSAFRNELLTPPTLAASRRLRINIYNKSDDQSVVTVNGARAVTFDLRMGNVLVHVIDRILMPASSQQRNIYQILNDGGLIDNLQAALIGPSLSTMLTSESTPMTVFVPTTDAFLKLATSNQTLRLLNNETAFDGLLRYHIVEGTYYSEGLEDGQQLTSMDHVGALRVNLSQRNRKNRLEKINGEANVVRSDVTAINGVVHFIDRVLTDILPASS